MRTILIALAVLALPHAAAASEKTSTSACYNINSADARAYCLARANRERSRCYNVQNPDLRAMCLAEVKQ